jgi:hypothetical protein
VALTTDETIQRIVETARTGERLLAIAEPIKTAHSMADTVVEIEPDLLAQMEEIKSDLRVLTVKLLAAYQIVSEKNERFFGPALEKNPPGLSLVD